MAAAEQFASLHHPDASDLSQTLDISAPQSQATATTYNFSFPPHYHFPPFFTLQPNLTTRASQLTSWSNLVLEYASRSSPRIFRLDSSHAIFTNSTLRRTLMPEDAREVFKHMIDHGRAAWPEANSGSTRKVVDGRPGIDGTEVWLYWHTPEEWARMINDWVEDTGQKNTVLTVYELIKGDATKDQEFHGLPLALAKSAIQVLTKRGKAQTLGDGEDLGIKIF